MISRKGLVGSQFSIITIIAVHSPPHGQLLWASVPLSPPCPFSDSSPFLPHPHTPGVSVLSGASCQPSHLPGSNSCQPQIPELVFIEENASVRGTSTQERRSGGGGGGVPEETWVSDGGGRLEVMSPNHFPPTSCSKPPAEKPRIGLVHPFTGLLLRTRHWLTPKDISASP